MMAARALAATSAIVSGLVDLPMAFAGTGSTTGSPPEAGKVEQVKRSVRYIRLKRGQKAPKGATVIRQAAPTPRVIVRKVVTSTPQQQPQRVARTRQSGG